jgi:hypothetical protein
MKEAKLNDVRAKYHRLRDGAFDRAERCGFEFILFLEAWMIENNISKADLHKRLGCSSRTAQRMFEEGRKLTLHDMVVLADALGMDLHMSLDFKEGTCKPSPDAP